MPEQQLVHAAARQPLRGVLGVTVAAHAEAGEPVSAPGQHIPRRDAPPQQVSVPLGRSGVAEVVGDELVTGRAAHHQPGQPARQPPVDGPLRTVAEQRAVRADVAAHREHPRERNRLSFAVLLAQRPHDPHVVFARRAGLAGHDLTQHRQRVGAHPDDGALRQRIEDVGGHHEHPHQFGVQARHQGQQPAHVQRHRRACAAGHRRHHQHQRRLVRVEFAHAGHVGGRHLRDRLDSKQRVPCRLQAVVDLAGLAQGDHSPDGAVLARARPRSGWRPPAGRAAPSWRWCRMPTRRPSAATAPRRGSHSCCPAVRTRCRCRLARGRWPVPRGRSRVRLARRSERIANPPSSFSIPAACSSERSWSMMNASVAPPEPPHPTTRNRRISFLP